MNSSHLTLTRLLAAVALVLFAGTGDAHAKKSIPKLYTFGGTTWEIGPVKDPAKYKLSADAQVGFYGKAFGLFWLNIWTWGAEPALIEGGKAAAISADDAAMLLGTDKSKIKTPWTYTFPPGLLIIVGFMALKIVPRIIARRKAAALQRQQQQQWNGGSSGAGTMNMPPPMQTPPPIQTPPPMPGAGTPPPVPPPMPPE
jgi:hypothetical protein